MRQRRRGGCAAVWPEFKTNVAFTCSRGAKSATDAAFPPRRARRADRDRQQPRRRQLHGDARHRRRI